jgi:hypothetical protein
MIYSIALLLFILGLVTVIPAIPQFLRMRKIRQNSVSTSGLVSLTQNSAGIRMAAFLGNVNYPQIFYRTLDGKEYNIEVVDSSNFNKYRYQSGESVGVVYNKSFPGEAYVTKEWDNALRDLWMGGGEVLVAIILWRIGIAFNLPL